MTKTELKAYLAVLKNTAKEGKKFNVLPANLVKIRGGEITATNGNVIVSLKTDVKGDGLYDIMALTSYEVDQNADLDSSRTVDAEEFVEFPKMEFTEGWFINDTNLGSLLKGFEFVGTDDYHAPLKNLVVKDGIMTATDGYRAFLAETDLPDTRFSQDVITAFKRVAKYGEWQLQTGEDENKMPLIKLTNGTLTIVGKVFESGFPEIKTVIEDRGTVFTHMLSIPLRDVVKFTDTKNKIIELADDGTISVGNALNPNDFVATPLKAIEAEIDPMKITDLCMPWKVIMPMAKSDEKLSLDTRLLKPLMDKKGNVVLFWGKGTMGFLVDASL